MKYLVSSLLIILFCQCELSCSQDTLISKTMLVEDLRQLASILESSHPDPYINGGGKVAFYIRLHEALESIPEKGMTIAQFYRVAASLAAQVGDAHTSIYDAYEYNRNSPGGIPLIFEATGRSLYIQAVPLKSSKELIGSVLLAVEGVPFKEIVARQSRLSGCDNYYTALALLGKRGNLFWAGPLTDLIPEWERGDSVEVTLKSPAGKVFTKDFKIPENIEYPFYEPESVISLPSTERCDFAWKFMDRSKKSAILRISHMVGYREDFELAGTSQTMGRLQNYWRRYNGSDPPGDVPAMISGIPSASESFYYLVEEMKENGTEVLVVDVRDNNGGNSLMMDFLLYFLYGREKYLWLKGETTTDITKLSELYFENRPNEDLLEIGSDYSYPLTLNDYDLRYCCYNNPDKLKSLNIGDILDQYFNLMPSFQKYWSDPGTPHFAPEKIYVLCNPGTLSGGYELMWALYRFGAKISGTPSGQAGNCFTNSLQFTLKNSGLEGQVSSKSQALFPGEPDRGMLLTPDLITDYHDLVRFNFDPNSTFRIVIEDLNHKNK